MKNIKKSIRWIALAAIIKAAMLCLNAPITQAQTNVSGTIFVNTNWTVGGSPYVVTGTVNVGTGVTLTIDPGVIVKFNSQQGINVNGTLIADGEEGSEIVFTSIKDDSYGGDTNNDGAASIPAPRDWGSICFNISSDDAACVLDHCIIKYGGYVTGSYIGSIICVNASPMISSNVVSNNYYGIYCTSTASPLITGNTISDNQLYGIYCSYGATPTITENKVSNNGNSGIYCLYSNATITGNTISDNQYHGVYINNSNTIINQNNIENNSNYGVYNNISTVIINAQQNWWGDATGPLDNSTDGWYNPDGQGNRVSDYVDYGAWLESRYLPGGVNTPPTVIIVDKPFEVDEGSTIEVTASGSDPDGDPINFVWDLDNDGTFETSGQNIIFSAAGIDGPISQTIVVKVTDSGDLTATDQTTVEVMNIAPILGDITAEPIDPVQVNTAINVSANFIDPGVFDTHTAEWDWGDASASPGSIEEANGTGTATGTHSYSVAGVYRIKLTLSDDDEGTGESFFQFIVVFNPEGGFVTGGGWIDSPEGAYTPDPTLTGKANFGFVSKYMKGNTIPEGNTQFNFKVADLKFSSTNYDWLVIAGPKAKFKGSGTINGNGDYGFMLTATDGEVNGGGGVDKFRIKIWNKNSNDETIYDNQIGDPDDGDATDVIEGGSILIHKGDGLEKSGEFVENMESEAIPQQYTLFQNNPNPFNPETEIRFELPEDCYVLITIFNSFGREICTLVNSQIQAGYHSYRWDGKDSKGNAVSSGVYFYQLQTGKFRQVNKMSLLR
jgi:parallel beta-helix repeat protein